MSTASTTKEFIDELVPIYTEIMTLSEDAKAILDKAKEQGFDKALLAKVAKAKAEAKLGKLQESVDALAKLLDEVA